MWESTALDSSEIVIDNLAGGGGASTGIENAIGRPVDYAVNHNAKALALHAANHPHTVVWWMQQRRPRVVMLENVSEFADWGPLLESGMPCPIRRGKSFRRWHKRIENLGYQVDMRELVAADHGAGTSRMYGGKPLSKTDQVWMLGNAVPPKMAEALVRANFQQQTTRLSTTW